MAASVRKSSANRPSAEKRAAEQAEELAVALRSFAASLQVLNAAKPADAKASPSNWWRTQAGRFKDDPTFAEFVAEVQAARKRER